ncbi:iron ABC transporter permease [Bacillus timonensis]|nr:iron ABC transporter permease [Bacillus timonensis]
MNKYKTVRFGRDHSISFLLDKKSIYIVAILLFFTITLFLVSTGIGEMNYNPLTVLSVLAGFGTDMQELVIKQFRLPRIIIALLVGISLAIAGSILQGVIRNPLASPEIIGITGGASVGVVSFLAAFSDANNALTVSIKWMPVSAFLGATFIAVIVYLLSWKNGVSPFRLVLIGIGVSALMQALTTMFMIMGPIYRATQANIWITGSVYGSNWSHVLILAPVVFILVMISLVLARHLNVQELGDELAKGIGSAVQKQRLLLLLVSTALTGSAVAFAGGIGFVGLMAPHIARRLVGSAFGALLPTAAFIGAILVMAADLIGRTLFSPLEVPAGVFTAAIGAPYFIYLLYKSRNS